MAKRVRYSPPLRSTLGSRLQYWSVPLLTFLVLVLFDVLIGGAIAALLQIDGFTTTDQRINEVYQLGYGIVTVATLLWLYFHSKSTIQILALVVLLLGFVEDALFYVLIPLCNPVIAIITNGATYHAKGGELFPASISGWSGWASRRMWGENFALAFENLMLISIVAVTIALLLLWWGARRQAKRTY